MFISLKKSVSISFKINFSKIMAPILNYFRPDFFEKMFKMTSKNGKNYIFLTAVFYCLPFLKDS